MQPIRLSDCMRLAHLLPSTTRRSPSMDVFDAGSADSVARQALFGARPGEPMAVGSGHQLGMSSRHVMDDVTQVCRRDAWGSNYHRILRIAHAFLVSRPASLCRMSCFDGYIENAWHLKVVHGWRELFDYAPPAECSRAVRPWFGDEFIIDAGDVPWEMSGTKVAVTHSRRGLVISEAGEVLADSSVVRMMPSISLAGEESACGFQGSVIESADVYEVPLETGRLVPRRASSAFTGSAVSWCGVSPVGLAVSCCVITLMAYRDLSPLVPRKAARSITIAVERDRGGVLFLEMRDGTICRAESDSDDFLVGASSPMGVWALRAARCV